MLSNYLLVNDEIENARYTTLPILHQDLWDMYKTHMHTFWQADEITFDNDWHLLSADEQHFVSYVLAFFASSDFIVIKAINRLKDDVKLIEAQSFYAIQNLIEIVHSEVYSNTIDAYIKDDARKKYLFNAVQDIPCIKKKADWAFKWFLQDGIDTAESFAERLVSNAIVEGVFFSGAFCSIFWLKERKPIILRGLIEGNDFISRDERLHVEFAVLLYVKYVKCKLTQKRFEEIITSAVDIECEFITKALPCSLLGMNCDLMCEYIKFTADRLALALGHNTVYAANNPFPFMAKIGLLGKKNFFEVRPNEYQLNHSNETATDEELHNIFA